MPSPNGAGERIVFDSEYIRRRYKWMDEETVGGVLLMDSSFVGDGGIPHTPPLGKAASPDPTMFASQRVSGRGVYTCVIRNRIGVDCDLAFCVICRDLNWRLGHLEEKVLSAQPSGGIGWREVALNRKDVDMRSKVLRMPL